MALLIIQFTTQQKENISFMYSSLKFHAAHKEGIKQVLLLHFACLPGATVPSCSKKNITPDLGGHLPQRRRAPGRTMEHYGLCGLFVKSTLFVN